MISIPEDRDKAGAPEAHSASGPEAAAGHDNREHKKPEGDEATVREHSNGPDRGGDNGRPRTRVRLEVKAHIL